MGISLFCCMSSVKAASVTFRAGSGSFIRSRDSAGTYDNMQMDLLQAERLKLLLMKSHLASLIGLVSVDLLQSCCP